VTFLDGIVISGEFRMLINDAGNYVTLIVIFLEMELEFSAEIFNGGNCVGLRIGGLVADKVGTDSGHHTLLGGAPLAFQPDGMVVDCSHGWI